MDDGLQDRLRAGLASMECKVITSCHQPRFWSAVPNWVKNLRRFDDFPIDIVALDDFSFNDEDHLVRTIPKADGRKLVYGAVDSVRLDWLITQLSIGISCFQIDIDIIFKKSIRPLLDTPHDFLISRAFGFPKFALEKLGFVGCCGFFVAKSLSLTFCRELLRRLESNADGSGLDQFVFNKMLVEAAEQGKWSKAVYKIDDGALEIDEFLVEDCRVGVLPARAISRNLDKSAIFGNHCGEVIDILLNG